MRPPDEFHPSDLKNDPAGQEQASRVARSSALRIALERCGFWSTEEMVDLVRFFNGTPLPRMEQVSIMPFLAPPDGLTPMQLEVFTELGTKLGL